MNAIPDGSASPGALAKAKNFFQGTQGTVEKKITDFLQWPDRHRTPEGRRVARIVQAVGIIFIAGIIIGFSIWSVGGMTALISPLASFSSFGVFISLPMPIFLGGYGLSKLFDGIFDSSHPKARRIAMCVAAVSVPILCFATGITFIAATSVAAGFTALSLGVWATAGAVIFPTGFFAMGNAINVCRQKPSYQEFGNRHRHEDAKHLQQEIEMQELTSSPP